MACQFTLLDMDERQITDEEGYSILEATVALEIDGRNVFRSVGVEGARHTVIMHSREQWINETLDMVGDFKENPKSDAEYSFWMYGTGFGFKLKRNGDLVSVHLEVNAAGPTQGVSWPQTVQVGTVSSEEWIEAIVSVSKQLSDMFLRLNKELYRDRLFQEQQRNLMMLENRLS